jgi:hypothetical protein
MKQLKISVLSISLLLSSVFAQSEEVKPLTIVTAESVVASAQDLNSAIGKWKSIDDETGKTK